MLLLCCSLFYIIEKVIAHEDMKRNNGGEKWMKNGTR